MDYNGYIRFLGKKFNFIWNDGTYFVISKISSNTLNNTSIWYNIVIGENREKIAIPYMNNYNNMLFLLILIEISIEVLKEEKSDIIRMLGTSIVGIVLFFIVWEARSRYIYFLIPAFCIIGAKGIMDLTEIIDKRVCKPEMNMSSKKGNIDDREET